MDRIEPSVTVLGLGAMGSALAAALVAAGHQPSVWNRTPGKAASLGLDGAATAADAIAASELVLVCLLDYASVAAVLDGVPLEGRTVVNLTNGAPAQAREAAARVKAAGADYVDGGIMAVPPMIGGDGAFILYSGSQVGFARAEPVLAVLGRPVFLGTDPGHAALYDLALLSGMYGMFAGASHAVALLETEGVAAEPFTGTLLKPWLEAMLSALPPDPASEDSNAAMQVAALDNMLATSRAQGVQEGLDGHLLASLQLLRRAA